MNNLPRQMLRRIINKHGKNICDDARRCEGLLNDLCGAHRREINVLVNAIEERVPLDLLAGNKTLASELLLTRLEKRLEDQQGLTAEAARWAVESWALALDIVADAEIDERQRKRAETANAETRNPPEPPKRSANNEGLNRSAANSAPLPKPPASPPVAAPPINRQSVGLPRNAPAGASPATRRPPQPPLVNPQPQPPTRTTTVFKSRFGVMRGCLVIAFLLAAASIVLFLGVPYAIEVMRETQREKNSEPPRFPTR